MGRFISILCKVDTIKTRIKNLEKKLSAEELDKVMYAKANELYRFMVDNTPVNSRYTRKGVNTRDSWVIKKNTNASYSVRNYKKQMLWLEEGTKSPILPVRAKILYIPLNQRGYDSSSKFNRYDV